MRDIRKAPRGEDEGLGAFASEDEPRSAGDARPRRTAVITALALSVIVVAAMVMLQRGTRHASRGADQALLPARAAMPRVVPASPPAVVPEGVATTGSLTPAVRRQVATPAVRRSVIASKGVTALGVDALAAVIPTAPTVEEASPAEEIFTAAPEPRPVTTEAVTIVAHARDRMATNLVLRAYTDSYNRMDSGSIAQVWPSVDTAALNRAFSTLAGQHLAFDSCEMEFVATGATARCVGAVSYVPRVGDRTPRVRRMQWTIELVRSGDRWQISGMTAR